MKKLKLIITESQRDLILRKFILNENLYGKKVIEQLGNRWNVQIDEKLENKLAKELIGDFSPSSFLRN